MNIALWIASGALALFVAAAGFVKAFRPIAETRKMPWTNGKSDNTIRLIGFSEILGALGLILPTATGIAPILTPIAALCLAVLMGGATVTHVRIKDPNSAAITTAVLMAIALFIAVGRFAGLA
jgi:uncharacterized membrane protein